MIPGVDPYHLLSAYVNQYGKMHGGCKKTLFEIEEECAKDLEDGVVPRQLRETFVKHSRALTQTKIKIRTQEENYKWTMHDQRYGKHYCIRRRGQSLVVYDIG